VRIALMLSAALPAVPCKKIISAFPLSALGPISNFLDPRQKKKAAARHWRLRRRGQ